MDDTGSNVAKGRDFAEQTRDALTALKGWSFADEVSIGIGNPKKAHRFDLADPSARFAVECKAFTWTSSGNMPSAKITTAREALLYLQWLPEKWTKVLAMSRSLRSGYEESLAEYFVRLNDHLLGDVVVIEVHDGEMNILHGRLAA